MRAFWQAELRADPVQPRIKGLIPYNSLSHDLGGFREKISRGAFSDSIRSGPILALWSHDASKPLASTGNGTLRLKDTDKGLFIEMDLDTSISWANDAYRSVKSGTLTGLSFGFTLEPGGDYWPEPNLREIRKATLKEVSPVSWAAYPASQVSARNKTTTMEERKIKEMEATKNFFSNDARPTRQKPGGEFRNNMDFFNAVAEAGSLTDIKRDIDPRLVRSGTGLNETVASEGGFLAPDALRDSLLYGDDSSKLKPLCDTYRVTSGGSTVNFPMVDETSRISGSQLGGLPAEWLYENKGLTYVQPRLRGLSLSLKKLGALIPATDELFESGSIAEMARF